MAKSFSLFGDLASSFEEKALKKEHKETTAKPAKESSKSSSAYRTISEAANGLGVATHVLRFWETKFHQIQPWAKEE